MESYSADVPVDRTVDNFIAIYFGVLAEGGSFPTSIYVQEENPDGTKCIDNAPPRRKKKSPESLPIQYPLRRPVHKIISPSLPLSLFLSPLNSWAHRA